MNLPGAGNVYICRVGVRERIVFSEKGEHKMTHGVIATSELMKMKKGNAPGCSSIGAFLLVSISKQSKQMATGHLL